jgi:protein tyrosine phosphatase (PTP) superfamily phosphohydrolase (DUF442 family)
MRDASSRKAREAGRPCFAARAGQLRRAVRLPYNESLPFFGGNTMNRIRGKLAALPRRARQGLFVAVALAAIAAAVLWATRTPESERLPPRFHVVTPGELYRSGQPTERELENMVRDYGIRTILNLRGPAYPELEMEGRAAERLGLKMVHVSVMSTRAPLPDERNTIRRVLADPTGYPILVHCKHGKARTGLIVALWRIEQDGWPGNRAVEEMIEKGYPVRKKSDAIREQLRRWRPGMLTSPPAAGN